MELNRLLIKFRSPEQVLYYGDRTIELFRMHRGFFEKVRSLERGSSDRLLPSEIKKDLTDTGTGIILNSGHFVFNLLTFDKIPFMKRKKNELVDWRVERLFPENINSYIHEFIQFDKTRILSILVKKDLINSLESEFKTFGTNLIYFGNSTIEIMNNLRRKKVKPDFLIEADGRMMLAVFFRNGLPVYIRKMRSGRGTVTGDEINRTVEFVEKNYGYKPLSCSVFSADGQNKEIQNELKELNLKLIAQENSDLMFLPGVK